jgi:hypothetical protein
MNINLIYKENSFSFDLRKDISIKYVEDLASKLINKDKSSFDLLYKDNIISESSDSLLKDIVDTDTNIQIIISPKNKVPKLNIMKILPKVKLFNNINLNLNKKQSIDRNNDLIINKTEIMNSLSDNSLKEKQELSKNNFSFDKYKINGKKQQLKNAVFIGIYNNKENELLSLMINLSQKIKEYDSILYKKHKNDERNSKNNKELLLFEKNVIEFKNKQINLFKKLIKYFESKENDFLKGNIILNEFYSDLKNYDNNKIQNLKKMSSIKKKDEEILLSPISNKNLNIYSNNDKESSLPLLININEINSRNKLYLSEKKINKTLNEKEEKINKPLLNIEKSQTKETKSKSRNGNDNLYQYINIQEKVICKTIDSKQENKNTNYFKKSSLQNTTEINKKSNDHSALNKPEDKASNIFHNNLPKKLSNKNNLYYDNNVIINNNFNDNTNNEINNEIKNSIKKNKKALKRLYTIEPINYNQKKLTSLYENNNYETQSNIKEESEPMEDENSSKSEDSISSIIEEEKDGNKEKGEEIKQLKRNLGRKKSTIDYSHIKNPQIGFLIKAKSRKVNQRNKKLGQNPNDFLI